MKRGDIGFGFMQVRIVVILADFCLLTFKLVIYF